MFKLISDLMAQWYAMWNTIVMAIDVCIAKKIICTFMIIISYYYGIKCLSNLLQLHPCYVMFKVISDIIAHWYDMWNTIVIAITNCNAKWFIPPWLLIINIYDKQSWWYKMS